MSKEKYAGRKYSILEYDPNWVLKYESVAKALHEVLGDKVISIEHIGSTSVPGMAGKPTIDILAIVQNIEDANGFKTTLQSLGYTFLGQYVMKDSRLYVKEENGTRLVNLHFFQHDHPHVNSMLKLRDYLREHPETVREYSRLKFTLAGKYPEDYAAYRKHKDEWMSAFKERIGFE